ncbi:hypothetical protein KCU65_g2636, partial [Aureobasidium melanogenum]
MAKSLSELHSDLLAMNWDVDYRLSHFVENPKDFRQVLGVNEGLIVGSLAFRFFSRVYCKDSTLDIFVETGAKATAISTYFRNEGYRRQKVQSFNGEKYKFKMTPWVKKGDAERKVNIITAKLMSIWAFFEGPAFCTAAACFITYDAAYCLFPKYTFMDRKVKFAQDLEDTHDSVLPILRSYIERGCCLDHSSLDQGPDLAQELEDTVRRLGGPRRIGDEKTLTIPLDCTDFPQIEVNRTVVEKNTFRVKVKMAKDGSGVFVRFRTLEFQCCILKHRYAFDVIKDPEDDFHGYLRYVLSHRAAKQIQDHVDAGTFTLPEDSYREALTNMANATETDMGGDKCNEYCHLLDPDWLKEEFIKPEGWQHADHLIPGIYAEWLERYQRDHGIAVKVKEESDDDEETDEDMEDI